MSDSEGKLPIRYHAAKDGTLYPHHSSKWPTDDLTRRICEEVKDGATIKQAA